MEFTAALRGYDSSQVDKVFRQVDQALAAGDAASLASARAVLERSDFVIALRGYDRHEVDEAKADRLRLLDGSHGSYQGSVVMNGASTEDFTVVLRGYDMKQVAAALAEADTALASSDAFARARARDALTGAVFPQRLRGYSRDQVDRAVQQRLTALAPGG